MRHAAAYVLIVLGLCVATLLVVNAGARFRVVDAMPMANLDFKQGAAHWYAGAGGVGLTATERPVLVITAQPGAKPAWVSRPLPRPKAGDHIRVSAELRTIELAAGSEEWQGGHLQLVSFDDRDRRLWYWPRRVARLVGSHDWRRYAFTFPSSSEIRSMWISAYAAAESGRLLLRDLRVERVAEAGAFRALRYALVAGWAGAWLWAAAILGHRHRSVPRLAVGKIECRS